MTEATLTTPAPAAAPSQQAAAPAAPNSSSSPAAATASAPSDQTPAQPAAPQNLVSAASPVVPAIPDKFRVSHADGTIDHEATLAKALGSYAHLEKRFSSGDVPPETEEGYKLDYSAFPEGIKINPEGEKALLKSLHASGMTNKQVQTVINKYGEVIKQGIDIQKQQDTERVTATLRDVATELKTAWGENNDANVQAAVRGFNHLADETDKADISNIGIDAKATYRILMKVLAKVGAGVTEDRQVLNAEGAGLDGTLDTLRKSEAYTNVNHADHKSTVAKVTALYQKKYQKK